MTKERQNVLYVLVVFRSEFCSTDSFQFSYIIVITDSHICEILNVSKFICWKNLININYLAEIFVRTNVANYGIALWSVIVMTFQDVNNKLSVLQESKRQATDKFSIENSKFLRIAYRWVDICIKWVYLILVPFSSLISHCMLSESLCICSIDTLIW